jgi:carboxylesterase type B
LDIYVPKAIKATDCVPVLVWVHGGGYIFGSKEMWGDPAVLIKSADKPMIYVSINYRYV